MFYPSFGPASPPDTSDGLSEVMSVRLCAGAYARGSGKGVRSVRPGDREGAAGVAHAKRFQAIQTPVFTGYEPVISARAAGWPEGADSVTPFSIFQHFKKPVFAGSEPEISASAAGLEIA